jgi:hypothetical protein
VSTLIGDLGEFNLTSLVFELDLGDFGSLPLLGDCGDLLASAVVAAGDFGDLLLPVADFGERVSSFFSLI